MSAIWHDVECGSYAEDLALWVALAQERGGPVLDVGAGTGRVALHLARRGHAVTALDNDPALLEELAARARALDVTTVGADARTFELSQDFPLIIVPMQTVQLLGGAAGRAAMLTRAHAHLYPGGLLAIAIADSLEPFSIDDGDPEPVPDIRQHDGVVYASRPVAVRERPDGFVLERRRETITTAGRRDVEENSIMLDRVSAAELEAEGRAVGFAAGARCHIPATADYVGSTVVMLGA
jgi:SAM-dependent methyltransferase